MSRRHADADVPASASGDYMRQVSLRWQVDVHPGRSLEVEEAVRDELNGRLMRHDERLGGVMLSYWDERIVSRKAEVLELLPYIRVVVLATALVFKPRVGTILEGIVNEVRDDFLHLLVFGVFHVSIGRGRIRKDFNFVPGLHDVTAATKTSSSVPRQSSALSSDPGSGLFALQSARDRRHRVVGGGRVRFAVAGVDAFAQELVSFTGAMEQDDTGSADYLDSAAGASGGGSGGGESMSAPKKKKKRSRDEEEDGAGPAGANGVLLHNGTNGVHSSNGGVDEEEAEREKKRRRKEKKEEKKKLKEKEKAAEDSDS